MKLALVGRDANRVLAFRGSLVRAAQARGHQVIAITGPTTEDQVHALAQAGVRCLPVALDAGGMHPMRDRWYQISVRQLLRRERPDALLAYNPKPLAFATRAARQAGVPRVVGMVTGLGHGFMGHSMRERLVRWIKARLYRRAFEACDAILLQNALDREELRRCGALADSHLARVRMIAGSGVDLEHFAACALPQGARFLMIARPLREKGLPEYFAAAREVAKRVPDATFEWLGPLHDTNPSAMAEGEIAALLAEGVVRHVPECDDVRPALAACSVFVLPSHREGTSKVMLEAMAMGRPIVTTDAPGCADVPAHEAGRTVPVGNAAALADAMIEFGCSAALRSRAGEAARLCAESRFDHRTVDATVLDALGL